MESARAGAAPINRTKSTSGCLVCRLRSKKCIRLQDSGACSECSHFRLVCHQRTGSIPSSMRDHPACREARDEIYEATNTARARIFDHPLPATRVFAELLKSTALNRGNVPAPEPQWHRSVPSDAGNPPLSFNNSGGMESFPTEALYFAPLVPYEADPRFGSHRPLPPHPYVPVGAPEDAPDRVVYPLQSPVSTNAINDRMPRSGAEPHHSRPPIPIPSYHSQTAPGGPDLETIIEGLRPLFWWCGYDIVPPPRGREL